MISDNERSHPPDASVRAAEIDWAASYNAYDRLAGGPNELSALLEPLRAEYRRSGRIPEWCGVDLLRGWAFLLYREDYFDGGGSLSAEWQAVLSAVRDHDQATGADLPPRRVSDTNREGDLDG